MHARDRRSSLGLDRVSTWLLAGSALVALACSVSDAGLGGGNATSIDGGIAGSAAAGGSAVAGAGAKGGSSPVAGAGGTVPATGGVVGTGGMVVAGTGGTVAGTGGSGGSGGSAGGPPPMVTDGIVAVGYGGRRAFSADGRTWKDLVQDEGARNDTPKALRGVAYGKGVVVTVGGGCAGAACTGRIVSFDGAAWKEETIPAATGVLRDVAFGSGRFVAVGDNGPVLASADGHTWAPVKNGAGTGPLRAIAFGMLNDGPTFVAAGDNSTLARSLDGGDTWQDVRRGPRVESQEFALEDVTIGDGVAIAVGEGGRRFNSRDGKTWNFTAAGNRITSVVFADAQFWAYVDNGNVWLTKNQGQSWDAVAGVDTPRVAAATGLLEGERMFVGSSASPTGGTARFSTSGIAYMEMTGAPTEAPFLRFAFVGPSNAR